MKYILLFFVAFFCCGKFLDLEAERVISQLYVYDSNNIITGARDIIHINVSINKIGISNKHKTKAILFIHGYLSDPSWCTDIINKLKRKTNCDLYSLLLPSHGRGLRKASQLSNEDVEKFIYNKIVYLSKKYGQLVN